MSEAPVDHAAPSTCVADEPPTPPRSTPSPTELDTADSKLSRKRGREVSLEPPTPTANDDPFIRERKSSGLPLKKNRRVLDPTEEEEDNALPSGGSGSRSVSRSPEIRDDDSVLTSPRREMKRKVRQISQGVEDISWKGPVEPSISEKDVEIADDIVTAATDIICPTTSLVVPGGHELFDNVEEEETPPKTPEESVLSRAVPDLNIGPDLNVHISSQTTGAADDGRLHPLPESNEKGLKRKFLERGTSQGPPEENEHPAKQAGEPLKRLRDDSKDDNLRERKRPSPPPSPSRSPTSSKGFKQSGFMAYASTASPFASVKGQNIFSSRSPPSIFAAGTTTSQLPIRLAPAFGSSTLTRPPVKRSGFGAFASSSSPFASFANRPRDESPNGNTPHSPERTATPTTGGFGYADREYRHEGDQPQTFGEKLRAAKDDEYENTDAEGKAKLAEQDVMTGEEEEETIHQVRGKLFSLQGSSWKEKGTGVLRLNVKQEDGTGARLVMRKDAVYTLLLNVTLFPGMRCTLAQDPRYLRFTTIENGAATTYNLKMADAKVAQDLLEEIRANTPSS